MDFSVGMGGDQKVTIKEGDVQDGSILNITVLGDFELTVDGVSTSIGNVNVFQAGSSSAFNAINGGRLTVDQGIFNIKRDNGFTFGVGENSEVVLNLFEFRAFSGPNKFFVNFSSEGTGAFTFNRGKGALADEPTFEVAGMKPGDTLNLGGGEWALDEGLLDWGEAYHDGFLHLTQGSAVVGSKVNAKIKMTREEFNEFMKDPNAYLAGGTYTQVCFAAGTMIATPDGEIAVETLSIGDLVMTASGESVPVKWLGRQTIGRLTASGNNAPVRVREDALAPGQPNRDLVLTAHHGLVIDDLVIDAGALVNHDSIDYVPNSELPDTVTYYHIEMENREVVIANGTEVETYIDYIDRQAFDNYDEYVALYGTETRVIEMPRHRISSRRLVPMALRERLGIQDMVQFS
ncbi:Hint domain-containing protein [Halomonas caseinilytica]|uniref:Hint domain-containing protein n=1 Tax=Halomonas caseinilytica TaxID=438744 RepID=A0A1M7AAX3_9GAMM|nr:Hint domain-containing protein [Halomonas caseinilytica]SHL39820.1 Hint domain-containing protein [Halomonas caseinilytica]